VLTQKCAVQSREREHGADVQRREGLMEEEAMMRRVRAEEVQAVALRESRVFVQAQL
jgi:hypothetical protein